MAVSAIAPIRFESMTRTLVRLSDGSGPKSPANRPLGGSNPLADGAGGRLAPELLEAVERAGVRREDVDHAVPVVHEYPARLACALDARRVDPLRLERPVDRVVNRLGLALGPAAADEEVVGVPDERPDVEHADVARLPIRRDLRDPVRQPLRRGDGHDEDATAPALEA